MSSLSLQELRSAEQVIRQHLSPAPLIRAERLEKALGLKSGRRVWIKDYGWTPVGSFKLLGALNWMAQHHEEIGDRPVAAHSSGNFASGIAFAGMRYQKRVIVVMPETAPRVKFNLTKSFGAEIRTYDIARDHITGERDRLTREIAEKEHGIQASPYDDPHVIAGNGVGGLEIVDELRRLGRNLSHFVCPVSGGGLMAGHAIAIASGYPQARIIGVEPEGADDFRRSLEAGKRVRNEKPSGICDGLLSYDVGEHNWPILREFVKETAVVPDLETQRALGWWYQEMGLRVEPSGGITTAAVMSGRVDLEGSGDVVLVVSGRNVDEAAFREHLAASL